MVSFPESIVIDMRATRDGDIVKSLNTLSSFVSIVHMDSWTAFHAFNGIANSKYVPFEVHNKIR